MKAVFLDRDGTVTVERGYVTVPEMIELIPGAAAAILRLKEGGWKVFVVTNQACVAKGMISEEELGMIHFRLVSMLGAEGAEVDGIYTCPHHPEGAVPELAVDCDCRKPRPGLLERAASEHDLDLSRCVMIGDSLRDLQAGQAAGARSILVRTGLGKSVGDEHGAVHVAEDLSGAVDWILREAGTA